MMGVPVAVPSPAAPSAAKPAAWSPPAPDTSRHAVVAQVVDRVQEEIAGRGPEYAALAKLSREVIEKIAWEVVPELAEAIIKEQLDRLVKERA
jgi:hypothetical protein